ncbi:NAD(P) transhydrogenase subunit alpha [Haloechinothrix alba]|uniref:NAD(P) transhydrogenase subunit alpha n=1 Tax=Haloechinothrix alba TaxID=664784 RepID=UPI001FEA5740|nr:NAD(P) transhydrogenase subunit alpha [Haloechinothrix alba]
MAGAGSGVESVVSVGVVAEQVAGEARVALVPGMVQRLTQRGVGVVVASGAGVGAFVSDEAFVAAGARVGDPWEADIVVCVHAPGEADVARARPGAVVVGFVDPYAGSERFERWDRLGVVGFALESVPRISRAQAMDALSSQANVAGYRAVLVGAWHLPRFFPMLTTAAGTVKPASVLVLGAGVAGLQALATAKRLGARASGYDVRPEVADQVRSVGARWLDLGIEAVGEGGYARELSEDERAEQQRRLGEAITGFDVVITTALVPGRAAPRLVSAEAVAGMAPGSVVVDLAGEAGGNCELTQPGEVVTAHGVTIAAPANLPGEMPGHASELYARNIVEFLELVIGEGGLTLDAGDPIIAEACVSGRDRLTWPTEAAAGESGAAGKEVW